VGAFDPVGLSALDQALAGVLADRLQQVVPGAGVPVHDDQ
jgi:hypothetical protein